ncbi:MAG: NADH-quinone oxidoreductase subunit C [Candidatus Bipolaricaulota bacterium]
MNPREIRDVFEEKFGDQISQSFRLKERKAGTADKTTYEIWMRLPKEDLREGIKQLKTFEYPHLTVISGEDKSDCIEVIYHLTLGSGKAFGEILINLRTRAPKPDPSLPTIADIIPGSLSTEREQHEFLGIEFEGTPDDRHLFLPDDMEIHPWRKDEEKEVDSHVKEMDEQP